MSAEDLNLPWRVDQVLPELSDGMFPWLVVNKWGVVIGRFDREAQARAVVKAVNQ